jgi:Na+/H+-dicarboxylate symporter
MSESRRKLPFFVWILCGLAAGLLLGLAAKRFGWNLSGLKVISDLVLQGLQLLATPLIFVAVVLALIRAQISGGKGLKLGWLLATNTLVAIVIGLLVANLFQPGAGANLVPTESDHLKMEAKKEFHVVNDLLMRLIPKSIGAPFVANDVLAIVMLALAFGFAIRAVRRKMPSQQSGIALIEQLLDALFQIILQLLHALFIFVPFAVFAVVATVVGREGFGAFATFAKFVVAVLLALSLQATFYLIRLRAGSWVRPGYFLKHSAEALMVAFSTASSAATLPVTYRCAAEKIRLREENARLGTMVGGNLNNDGTALYEAMAALFIAQAMGLQMELSQQILLVFMSVVASVGAAGIPEAGLVTMMAVFSAVKLPVDYIPLLLTVDWFLDRCRTAMNVMGDLTVSSLLDGKEPASAEKPA